MKRTDQHILVMHNGYCWCLLEAMYKHCMRTSPGEGNGKSKTFFGDLFTTLLNPSYLQNQTIDYLQYNTCKTHLHPWPDTYAAKHYKLSLATVTV